MVKLESDVWESDTKDLSTPEHDALVLLLFDNDYLKTRVIRKENYDDVSIVRVVSEEPFVESNGFTRGYQDVVVIYNGITKCVKVRCPICRAFPFEKAYPIHVEKAVANKTLYTCRHCGNKFVVTPDIIEDDGDSAEECKYYIECKPRVESFGSTLRQMNKYREFVRRRIGGISACKFVLFTPDIRFKKEFESQGYLVISP